MDVKGRNGANEFMNDVQITITPWLIGDDFIFSTISNNDFVSLLSYFSSCTELEVFFYQDEIGKICA